MSMYAWRSPDGITRNQIDYLLIDKRRRTSIRDVKTYPSLDCGSDSNALVAELGFKLRNKVRSVQRINHLNFGNNPKYNQNVLDSLKQIYQRNIYERYVELWTEIKTAIGTTALSIYIKAEDQPRKPWIC